MKSKMSTSVPSANFQCVMSAWGIEPAFSAWEADVLPLNYARGRRHTILWAA